VSQTVSELCEAHMARDIRCLATEAEGDFRGNWDAERIGQLVSNLVGNAIQHGHDPIVVEAKDMGATVGIEVRSAGELDERVAHRLFEPFVSSRGGKRRGLGLGLYIVREVAKAHGGSVLVESGRGSTTFRVELPRGHRARAHAKRPVAETRRNARYRPGARARTRSTLVVHLSRVRIPLVRETSVRSTSPLTSWMSSATSGAIA